MAGVAAISSRRPGPTARAISIRCCKATGRDGIDAMIVGVQERFPGHRFRRTGDVESHHDRVRFTWDLAPEAGDPVVKGTDFGIVTPDNRLQAITGFFDHVKSH